MEKTIYSKDKRRLFMEIKKEDIPYNMINMLNIVGMEKLLKIKLIEDLIHQFLIKK